MNKKTEYQDEMWKFGFNVSRNDIKRPELPQQMEVVLASRVAASEGEVKGCVCLHPSVFLEPADLQSVVVRQTSP